MTRKILINGRREEELRVAIVENQTLEDFEIECKNSGLLRNNIYRGVVSNIAPSLNAAFIDFGDVKNGFLAFNDVVESCYHKPVKDAQRISDVLVVGQPLIVQVIKDATSLKGAQVTTNISLAGRYLVLRPKDAKSGVSRKVDDDQRADLTQKARSLDLPDGYGCIVRTNAIDQSRAILLRDAKVLIQLWHKIEAEYARHASPCLLYNDQDIVVQAMRDYFDSTIGEVLVDDRSCYERALSYLKATTDGAEAKVKLYEDRTPLFSRYNIERQINQIYARTVTLPSGGFIVIDPTEALTAIDVNSARATKSTSQDQTAYRTNLEAAEEIGRQLRMRDIGGLIVIDFIDMKQSKYQRDVERAMRNAMSRDKARNKVERISANGLLEINRQRLSQTVLMRTHLECPTCGGRGFIPTVEAMGLNLMREIEARAVQGTISGAIIKLNPENAQTVQNERRHDIVQLEEEYDLHIEIIAVREMSRGEESIQWLSKDEVAALHPNHTPAVSVAAIEASDVVEVVEAYNAQSPMIDDSYRPNDFEEFSSEEARKRRASRRSRRSQHAACACTEHEPQQDTIDSPENVQKRIGLAILNALLKGSASHLDDRANEPRRRMTIRGRRRPHRENGGINTDTCLFALDVVRAICVLDGVEGDINRKQLIDSVERCVTWIDRAINSPDEMMSARCASLLAQTNSRHARARLEVLFSGAEPAQSDALGLALCAERDGALHLEENFTEHTLNKINEAVKVRIAAIFGDENEANDENTASDAETAPSTFDTSELNAEPSKDAAPEESVLPRSGRTRRGRRHNTPNTPVEATTAPVEATTTPVEAEENQNVVEDNLEATPYDPALAVMANTRTRRHHTRRAIGETSYFRDNNEIVTADTEVAPMTMIEVNEDEDFEQAITQELPAIETRHGSRRNRRGDRRHIDENVVETPVQAAAEPVSEPEVVKIKHNNRNENAGQPERSSRRVRRTAPKINDANPLEQTPNQPIRANVVETENANDAIDNEISDMFNELTMNAMTQIEEMNGYRETPVESDDERSISEEIEEVRAFNRRERRTRRDRIGTPSAIMGEVVEVDPVTDEPIDNSIVAQPNEKADAEFENAVKTRRSHRGHRGGKGRNRNRDAQTQTTSNDVVNDSDKSAQTAIVAVEKKETAVVAVKKPAQTAVVAVNKNKTTDIVAVEKKETAIVAVEKKETALADPKLNAQVSDAPRESRRVRRTTRKINADAPVELQGESNVKANDNVKASNDVAESKPAVETRRVRRTTRKVAPVEADKAVETAQPVEKPVEVTKTVEKPVEATQTDTASNDESASTSRVRRTRRAKLGE